VTAAPVIDLFNPTNTAANWNVGSQAACGRLVFHNTLREVLADFHLVASSLRKNEQIGN
jgi:hypothetical protein